MTTDEQVFTDSVDGYLDAAIDAIATLFEDAHEMAIARGKVGADLCKVLRAWRDGDRKFPAHHTGYVDVLGADAYVDRIAACIVKLEAAAAREGLAFAELIEATCDTAYEGSSGDLYIPGIPEPEGDGRPDGETFVTAEHVDAAALCGSCGRGFGERHTATCRHEKARPARLTFSIHRVRFNGHEAKRIGHRVSQAKVCEAIAADPASLQGARYTVHVDGNEPAVCDRCEGVGRVADVRYPGAFREITCPACNGSGRA